MDFTAYKDWNAFEQATGIDSFAYVLRFPNTVTYVCKTELSKYSLRSAGLYVGSTEP